MDMVKLGNFYTVSKNIIVSDTIVDFEFLVIMKFTPKTIKSHFRIKNTIINIQNKHIIVGWDIHPF